MKANGKLTGSVAAALSGLALLSTPVSTADPNMPDPIVPDPDVIVEDVVLTPEEELLSDLDFYGYRGIVPDQVMLDLGYVVCDAWNAGASMGQVVESLQSQLGEAAPAFISSATAAFCPQHIGRYTLPAPVGIPE